MNFARPLLVAFLVAFVPALAAPHGGGLDRNGCHTNRKTGDYHCHGGGSSSGSSSPSRDATSSPQRPMSLLVQPVPESGQELVRAAQVLLHALGYRPSLLGSVDARTRAAIESFQASEGVAKDGRVTAALVLRLSEALAQRCQSQRY